MRIAIVGCGLTGAFLAHSLPECYDVNVDVYETTKDVRVCCGCAIPISCLKKFSKQTGLSWSDYVLHKVERVYVRLGRNLWEYDVEDLCIFDKRRWIQDLVSSANASFYFGRAFKDWGYDLVIDCTGVKRALLPRPSADLVIPAQRCHVRFPNETAYDDLYVEPFRLGYLWCFTISQREAIVGVSMLGEGPKLLRDFVRRHRGRILDVCGKGTRFSSPANSLPFRQGKVVGCGESIGCVAPMVGEGNMPSLTCAEILLENFDDLKRYEEEVLKRFVHFKTQHRFVRAVLEGKRIKALWYALRTREKPGYWAGVGFVNIVRLMIGSRK